MKVITKRTRVFVEGEDLEAFILKYIPKLKEKSVLVVTSKIVALAECRTGAISDKEKLIRSESTLAIRTKYTWLTIKDGVVMGAAGIDESNAAGKLVLLPKDSFKAAAILRTRLMKRYRIKKLGVVITDSRILPLRAGVVGVALGYAGFKGIRDYRGTKDIFGRVLKLSRTNVADGLATAAVLEMGEGNEQRPLAVITEASIDFVDRIRKNELHINIEDDVFRPMFDRLPKDSV